MNTDRIFQNGDGDWYYTKRGDDAGPFDSEAAARAALRRYLRRKSPSVDLLNTFKGVLRRLAA